MAVWGIGSCFEERKEQLDNFINGEFVCLGWRREEKPEYFKMLEEIKLGDIIYVKSYFIPTEPMTVKAICVVTETLRNSNSHNGYEQCDNEIGVKWLSTNLNKKIPIDSMFKERKSSIFKESNSAIIRDILSLL